MAAGRSGVLLGRPFFVQIRQVNLWHFGQYYY